MRHVARTHRINLDWCYEIFRWPEVKASYVSTHYQIADIGTKAIVKGETWERLITLMGIRAPGSLKSSAKADVTTNKLGQKTSSNTTQPSIGERTLQAQSVRLLSAMSEPLLSLPKPASICSGAGRRFGVLPRASSLCTASTSHPRSCSGCGVTGTEVSECLACAMASIPPVAAATEENNEKPQDKENNVKPSRGARRRLRRQSITACDESLTAMD